MSSKVHSCSRPVRCLLPVIRLVIVFTSEALHVRPNYSRLSWRSSRRVPPQLLASFSILCVSEIRRAIAPDVGNQGSHMLRLVLSFPIFLCLGGTSQHGIILFRANERTCQAFGLRSRESRIWSLQACCAVVLGAANGVDDRKIVIYLITHFVDCNSSKAEATTGSAKLLNCSKEATVAAIDAAAGPATIQKSFAPYTQSKSPTCHHHPVIFARWGRAGKWHAFLPFAPGESLQAKLYQRVATTPDA